MANPQFYTRIQLKYDTWANWNTEAALAKVPLKGEVCLVEVPSGAASGAAQATPPSVLMKVGDGTKTFAQLPWLSALSADVHSWAKKSEEDFLSWLDTTGKFATDAELAAVDGKVSALTTRVTTLEGTVNTDHETRIGDLEAALGTGGSAENSISKRVEALEGDMETVLGEATVPGSIAEAKKAGTDAAAAASTADGKAVAAQSAVDAVELQLAGIGAESGSVKTLIEAAAKKGEDAQADVDAVEEVLEGYTTKGSVASAINGLDERLEAAEGTIGDHTTQLGTVDSRIAAAINEFATKVTDNATFDTFKELVDYVADHEDVASALVADTEILNKVLKSYVEAGTPVEDAVKNAIDAVDGKVTGLTTRVDTLEDHVTDASKLVKGELSVDRLAASGVTAGTYGAAQTAVHGGTFAIPTVTVDNKGRVTSAGTVNVTLPSVTEIEGNITSLDGRVDTLEDHVTDASKLVKGTLPSARLEDVVAAGSVGSAQSSIAHGGNIAIPKITYDAKGRITKTETVNVTLPSVSGIEGEIDDLQTRMGNAEGAIGASTDTASKTGTLYARVAKAQADAETGISNANTAQTGVNTLSGLVGTKGDAATVDTAFGRIAKAQAAAEAAAGAASGAQNEVDALEKVLSGYTAEGSVKSAIEAAAGAASTADGKAVAAQGTANSAVAALGTLTAANAVSDAITAVDGRVTSLNTKVDSLSLDQIDANTEANYVVFNCGSASVLI